MALIVLAACCRCTGTLTSHGSSKHQTALHLPVPLWECWKDEDALTPAAETPTATVKTVKTTKREKTANLARGDNVGKDYVAQEIVLHPLTRVGGEQGALSIGVVTGTF